MRTIKQTKEQLVQSISVKLAHSRAAYNVRVEEIANWQDDDDATRLNDIIIERDTFENRISFLERQLGELQEQI